MKRGCVGVVVLGVGLGGAGFGWGGDGAGGARGGGGGGLGAGYRRAFPGRGCSVLAVAAPRLRTLYAERVSISRES